MKSNKVNLEQIISKHQLIGYLEDMVASLKSGKIVIESNGDYVRLIPPDSMKLSLSAKQKKEKAEMEFEISWAIPGVPKEQAPLKISADEPEEGAEKA